MTKPTTTGSESQSASGRAAAAPRKSSRRIDLSEQLFQLLEECADIAGAVVTTEDGHLIDSLARDDSLPVKELAAMSSTFMALGDTLSQRLKQGICRNVLVENELGTTLLLHAGEGKALMTATVRDARLGMVLSHSRKAAEAIATISAEGKNAPTPGSGGSYPKEADEPETLGI